MLEKFNKVLGGSKWMETLTPDGLLCIGAILFVLLGLLTVAGVIK